MFRWIIFLLLSALAGAVEITPAQVEFFENRIRPVLAQDCYECHRTEGKKKGGLALDHRAAMREGGDTEDLFNFDHPEKSYLIKLVRHEEEGMEMPRDGVKWSEEVVADFIQWIALGAPDPRDEPPGEAEIARDLDWRQVMNRRKQWWSLQPVREVIPPDGPGSPIDRFLNERIAEAGLPASPRADDRLLVRRLSYALRGIPPSPAEVSAYLDDSRPDRWDQLVDHFLASPRFGERWARHWMDWIRYADSHGSEGDPPIRNAWRYRDYLIRALNENVPYDTLLKEHLAGDLLPDPRIKDGRNESMIGPAHLRMVYHGFAPTDALDEKVRFTDDQINVVTKAFQGLTVSCARCHNHKFDAISQEDYYALFGIFGSTKPGVVRIDVSDEERQRAEMRKLKDRLKESAVQHWQNEKEQWTRHFRGSPEKFFSKERPKNDFFFLRAWADGALDRSSDSQSLPENPNPEETRRWRGEQLRAWTTHGEEIAAAPTTGTFSLAQEGPKLFSGIYPAGLYSHHLSSKDRGIALSPRLELAGNEEVWLRVRGNGNAVVRYAVQNYPRNGTVFPSSNLRGGSWRWIRHDLDYWKGDRIHLELSTARDQPILAGNDERSWFGISAAMVIPKGSSDPRTEQYQRSTTHWASQRRANESTPEFLSRLALEALTAFSRNDLHESQATLLDELLAVGILPNEAEIGGALLTRYRELEQSLAVPVRAPGVWEADAHDQEFFDRGNHQKPTHLVRRRFLEVFDDTPYDTSQSGRLPLARDFLRPDNPLTARVIVNRLWHHLFGAGLVRTPDNFGRLGEKPTHPGLLDYLAGEFVREGWDLKGLIRRMVTTEAWRRSSVPESRARERDPENKLLSYFSLRRLEAEAIRDGLLAVSGALDPTPFGPTVDGKSHRRSVYVRIQRNRLAPFLQTFNAPVPLGGKGRRDETNVPGQSLTLLNSPWVMDLARRWAAHLPGDTHSEKIHAAFLKAFSRPPTPEEAQSTLAFMESMAAERATRNEQRKRWDQEISRLEKEIAGLLATARTRLPRPEEASPEGPAPMARWDFDGDARDQMGSLHGTLHGGAVIRDGALVVGRKQGYFTSARLDRDLGAKTLQVLVKLDSLAQGGGGALGLQTPDGRVFDSIVYGETAPRQWIAGSEYHHRTVATGGTTETEAAGQPLWLTITYDRDGTIRIYRNGTPYGRSYRKGGLQTFKKDSAQIIIGNRHGTPTDDRLLAGRIFEARLFDRALTPEEVGLAIGAALPPTREALAAQLRPDEQKALASAEETLRSRRQKRNELQDLSEAGDPFTDLAHALFNSKEFIYVR